ncbi:helix-turn-helix domain-containing protein [Streptomyces sp. MJM1172]|uniref:helix-turn-helix domain-containing protein n=1 Tax=Streptomyces sp. MJM1172 TaxID=1703926 RepID=UPI0009400601|nr:helix-turn-helix domain-containing protein [Streptomyces sp. MJM1172]
MTQNVGTTSGESQDPEPVLPAPGERRKLREAAHLTYEQVAAAVGVTGTTVRSWELGRTEPRGRKRGSYAAFLAGLSERAAAHGHPAGGHPAGGHARPRPKSPARRAPHDPAPSRTPAPPPSRSTHPGPTPTPTAHPVPTTPSAQAPPRPDTPPSPQTAQATRAAQATPSPQPARSAHATEAAPSPQTAHADRAAGATSSPQSPLAPQAARATPTTLVTPAASAAPADPARAGATPVAPAITGMSAPEAAPDASEPQAAMGAPAIIGMSPPGAPDAPATANGSATGAGAPEATPGPPDVPAAPWTPNPLDAPATANSSAAGAGAPATPWTPNPLDAQAAAPEAAPGPPGAPGSTDTPIARWDPSTLAPAGAPAAPAANGSAATGAGAPEATPGPPGTPGSPDAPAAPSDPGTPDRADAAGAATGGGLDTPPPAAPGAREAPGADSGDPAEPPAPLTPADVFDALYDRAAPALLRQAYLLTGRRALAMESVERAFHLAWNRWPELIADPDPVGWVRSAAYEYALSPWHQFRRAHRHPDKPPAEPADRILLDAMLQLSPMHRRTVLLYDGIGLDLPDTAAETEATTPTAGNRLLRAHAELAARIPELAAVPPEKQSAVLRHRLGALRPSVPLEPRPAVAVRGSGEHRTRLWGRAVLGLTAMIAVATSYTLSTAPTHYIPPLAPGASVSGVPPLSGPQHLTQRSKELHDKLRNDPEAGPARLAPKAE